MTRVSRPIRSRAIPRRGCQCISTISLRQGQRAPFCMCSRSVPSTSRHCATHWRQAERNPAGPDRGAERDRRCCGAISFRFLRRNDSQHIGRDNLYRDHAKTPAVSVARINGRQWRFSVHRVICLHRIVGMIVISRPQFIWWPFDDLSPIQPGRENAPANSIGIRCWTTALFIEFNWTWPTPRRPRPPPRRRHASTAAPDPLLFPASDKMGRSRTSLWSF